MERGLRQLGVVKMNVAHQRGFQVFAADEMVALQHLLDAAVEALDHAVGLGVHRRRQAVLDAEVGAEQVELVLSRRGAFAQTEETVGEFLPVARSEQDVR